MEYLIFLLFSIVFFATILQALVMSFYIGSPIATALVITWIFLKMIQYSLYKLKKVELYSKVSKFNNKAFKIILLILIVLLIKYILYPRPFEVY